MVKLKQPVLTALLKQQKITTCQIFFSNSYLTLNHMSEFKIFKQKVQEQFLLMTTLSEKLFLTDVPKDKLWDTYLNSFPEGSNNIYKERREYDCNTCKQFIKPYANVVAIVNNKLVSIWDIQVPEPFQSVANAMSTLVKTAGVRDLFVSEFAKLGTDKNYQDDNGNIITWEHFYFELPKNKVYKGHDSIEAEQGRYRSSKQVFTRALEEINKEAIITVLELINQNSLYRGKEYEHTVIQLQQLKDKYDTLPEEEKDNYCWINTDENTVSHIRNTAIGTLLVNLSEGRELDEAVTAFERIMAPTNYKRPNAIFTKNMVEKAQEKIIELGLTESLGRRYANMDDIPVNNVLFVNRDIKKAKNIFEELEKESSTNLRNFSKVEEMSAEDFLKNVLPTSKNIEILFETKHIGNLVSLIAPQEKNAPSLFKWNNGFSWAYRGDVTDSIREKVKAAGGLVEGIMRASLSWFNYDDLDLHATEPNGSDIYFKNKVSSFTGGVLDVDMNAIKITRTPVENIIWPNQKNLKEGTYTIYVHNYTQRETTNVGFEAELEIAGQVYSISYPKPVRKDVKIATITYSNDKFSVSLSPNVNSQAITKEAWGLKTNTFYPVTMLMYSPNYWDDKIVGNKHLFFMINGCINDGTPRGFFNEYLKDEFTPHRKVFEALGNKIKVEPTEKQLNGLGFSMSKRDTITCKVTSAFTRIIKINF